MDLGLLEEVRFDWELAGKAARTVVDCCQSASQGRLR